MCLAMPAKIDQREDDTGWVRVGDARMKVHLIMTPEVQVGDWVLVHAGFSLHRLEEEAALRIWQLIEPILEDSKESES